ncbi:MAG: FAD-dependent oxidoreductase, partial [Patescibacteria group bacterium]|nr:FAD-dependent oxidoreductase [Patescibacteria group bacterium]
TSGAPAAIAAARQGARVALVEAGPNLGGTSSNQVVTYYWGVPWKSRLRLELDEQLDLKKRTTGGPREKIDFSGERKKLVLHQMALAAGVDVYYRSFGAGALMAGDRVAGAIIENAAGRHVLRAKVVIDATGHADVAVAAGAPFQKGRRSDGFLHRIEHGPLRDPTHIADISQSYVQYPARSVVMAIRESRRILGDYTLTFDDALAERLFPDAICRFRSNYDTHWPPNAGQSDRAQDWIALLGLWRRPIFGSIPYRSLLPEGLDGILVAAKAYSADHDALIPARMQPDLEHLGEAAGVAAAMAVQMNVSPRTVPVARLQAELVRLGVLRGEDAPRVTVTDAPPMSELLRQDVWGEERASSDPRWAARHVRTPEQAAKHLGTDESLDAMVELYLAGQSALPVLSSLLESPDVSTREEAVLLLGMLGDRAAVPGLMEFLRKRNPRTFCFSLPEATSRPSVPVYWSAVVLLGRFQEKQAVTPMLELLADPDECPPMLASFTIVALGRIGDARAIDAVRPYLAVADPTPVADESMQFERQWAIRTAAARTLSLLGDKSGVPVLIELLDADQALLRSYAHRLLEEITGQQIDRDRKAWEAWWQANQPAHRK